MSSSTRHRGPHPGDEEIFAEARVPSLREATGQLGWLLTRGYNRTSALKLVGDRHALTARQRKAVSHSACGDDALAARQARRLSPEQLRGRRLNLDGFNLLIVLESALSGAVLLRGRDGCMRDMASVHGTYRQVSETAAATRLLGQCMERLGVPGANFWLDRPVSNSGRLAALLRQEAEQRGWDWSVELTPNPDKDLVARARLGESACTGDAWILDNCGPWFDLTGYVVDEEVPEAWLLDLG